MMDLQVWRQHRGEILREVERNRRAKALRGSRKRRGMGPALAWELERIAGRLLKFLRTSRNVR